MLRDKLLLGPSLGTREHDHRLDDSRENKYKFCRRESRNSSKRGECEIWHAGHAGRETPETEEPRAFVGFAGRDSSFPSLAIPISFRFPLTGRLSILTVP